MRLNLRSLLDMMNCHLTDIHLFPKVQILQCVELSDLLSVIATIS